MPKGASSTGTLQVGPKVCPADVLDAAHDSRIFLMFVYRCEDLKEMRLDES